MQEVNTAHLEEVVTKSAESRLFMAHAGDSTSHKTASYGKVLEFFLHPTLAFPWRSHLSSLMLLSL